MKKAFLVLFSLFSFFSFAQSVNDYEYVMISKKYDFQRSPDEYQLNTLLKCQLEEYGFKVLYTADLPRVNIFDRCLILNANVISKSNIFLFKFLIEFTDCNNAIVYQSEIGGSKEKDLYDAFTEALDGALRSTKLANYKFQGVSREIIFSEGDQLQNLYPESAKTAQSAIEQDKLEQVKVEQSAVEKTTISKGTPDKKTVADKKPVKKKILVAKAKTFKKAKINAGVVSANKVQKKAAAVIQVVEHPKKEPIIIEETMIITSNEVLENKKEDTFSGIILYAQVIENGFQLVDTTPKVILKITNTLQPGYYDAKIDKKYGAVFIKNGQWVFEYFMDGKLISEPLTIKFYN